jgi:hypothetical protein
VFSSVVPAAAVITSGAATSDATREKDVTISFEDGQSYFRVSAFSSAASALETYLKPDDAADLMTTNTCLAQEIGVTTVHTGGVANPPTNVWAWSEAITTINLVFTEPVATPSVTAD